MRIADQSKLGSMSNVDIWSRTLLVVEEVDVSIQDKLANTIKSFMGTSWVDADRKHEHFGSYFSPANLSILSNNPPTMLQKADRRRYVKEMKPQPDPEAYFKNFTTGWSATGTKRLLTYCYNQPSDMSFLTAQDGPREGSSVRHGHEAGCARRAKNDRRSRWVRLYCGLFQGRV